MSPFFSASLSRRTGVVLFLLSSGLLCAALLGGVQPAQAQVPAAAARGKNGGGISGVVQDPSGALIPGTHIELRRTDGTVVAKATSDNAGQFHLAQPPAGDYQLSFGIDGFDPVVRPLHVTRAPLAAMKVTMKIASLATSVTVSAQDNVDLVAPDNNQDTPTISSDDMKSLPMLDDDVVTALSAFLDAGAAGEGGTTLIIDGVESKTVGVATAAIERVSINQDPYSAQYHQPGRGQVEIVTKSTADKFHGSITFNFRNSAMAAANYFATVKAPEEKQVYDGYLTGPIRGLKNTTFLFSTNRQMENAYQYVTATTPSGVENENVPAPNRTYNLTMKVAHQINDHHSAYLLYRFYDASHTQGIGGLTLPSAGYVSHNFDMDLTFHDDLAIGPNILNQFNLLFERNVDRTTSNQEAQAIVVQGAFTGGGAQNDQLQTESNPNLSEIVSWTAHKTHQLKFGIQIPNLGRRILDDLTNRQGTFTFASLAAYEANTPESFTLQRGQTRFETLFAQPGAFVQDQIQATPRLTITPGLRYDFQNALPGTKNAVQPRLSLAYAIDQKHGFVVRTGVGIYMRRVGANVGQLLARYEEPAEESLLLTTNLCYPDITACNSLAAQPPNRFVFAPGLKAPMQAYFGMSIERQLNKRSTLTIGYNGYRGWHALRSVDINAPLPPFTSSARPDPNYGQVLEQQSGAYQKSDDLSVSWRGRISNVFAGYLQYDYEHSDANTLWSTYTPMNQYDPNADWSRADNDQRHRLNFFGTFFPDYMVNLGLGLYDYSPTPYSETTGTDDFHTGIMNARPGCADPEPGESCTPRNTLNGGDYQDVQTRLNYVHKLRPRMKDASPTLTLSIASFNTLNRVNYGGYVGVVTSPDFMKPTTASNPRRLQLGASYNF